MLGATVKVNGFEWVKFAIALAVALAAITLTMIGIDRALARHLWRYLVVTTVGLLWGGILAILSAAIAGTPKWSAIISLGVVLLWVVVYAGWCAIRVGPERMDRKSSR
jgi:hypothetical protein